MFVCYFSPFVSSGSISFVWGIQVPKGIYEKENVYIWCAGALPSCECVGSAGYSHNTDDPNTGCATAHPDHN